MIPIIVPNRVVKFSSAWTSTGSSGRHPLLVDPADRADDRGGQDMPELVVGDVVVTVDPVEEPDRVEAADLVEVVDAPPRVEALAGSPCGALPGEHPQRVLRTPIP